MTEAISKLEGGCGVAAERTIVNWWFGMSREAGRSMKEKQGVYSQRLNATVVLKRGVCWIVGCATSPGAINT